MKISVALATYNEENNVVDCIESAKKIASEIVIVDGCSTDRTRELAVKNGAKVLKKSNKLMFNINKNIAIENCSGSWIFVIDADERISSGLAQEIKNLVQKTTKENGYFVNRKNWFLGGYLTKGGAYPDAVLRLIKRGKGKFPAKDVHEQIKVNGKVGNLNGDLLHLADPNFERYLKRADRYTDHTAIMIKKNDPGKSIVPIINYMFVKPVLTFTNIYFKHKGFQDGFRGFIWALFSGIHYFFAYVKYWQKIS